MTTKLPGFFTLPDSSKSGLKKPSFSHQSPQADSTTPGMYALWKASSSGARIFFSPFFVFSKYGGSSSFASSFFFSFFAVGAGVLTFLACFSANFFAFSAFNRSFSSSFADFSFFVAFLSPPSWPGACSPMISCFADCRILDLTSEEGDGGWPEGGLAFSPKMLCEAEFRAIQGVKALKTRTENARRRIVTDLHELRKFKRKRRMGESSRIFNAHELQLRIF